MHVDYLVIGQGICGTFLSRELQKANQSFIVIDESRPFTASKAASGIINPVTGRRIVKTWMIDKLLEFIIPAYTELGNELGIKAAQDCDTTDPSEFGGELLFFYGRKQCQFRGSFEN